MRSIPCLFLLACAAACAAPSAGAAPSTRPGLARGLVSDALETDNAAAPDTAVEYKRGDPGHGEPTARARAVEARDAAAPRERMLVQRGEVRVEVARADEAARAFVAEVEAWGGYLQSQTGTALVVRIPVEHFDAAFAAARAAGRVLFEQREAQDVTEEFVDLGIRLDNAKRARDRLLEVLKLADKVEDILKVEAELHRLTEEIERMEGRMKFLRDQVAMATLRVDFRAVAEPTPGPKPRTVSRFQWINRVGASAVLEAF